MRRIVTIVGTAICLSLLLHALAPADSSVERRRETMQRIFDALADLLPESLEADAFHDPRNRESVAAAIAELAGASAELAAHARVEDASFNFLAHSLVADVERLQRSHRERRYDRAQFFVHRLTEDCLTCHSRLPSDREYQMASRLTRKVAVKSLPLHQRARLEAATRQFDRALATYEELFQDESVEPVDFDLRGDLATYLTLAVRVCGNLGRPARTLSKLAERDDVPEYLEEFLRTWITTLKTLAEEDGGDATAATLTRARELAERGQRKAHDVLEEYLMLGHRKALPRDVREKLADLEKLIASASAKVEE